MVARGDRVDAGLYERERELLALESAVAAARQGAGSVIMVLGPAGIGKSRLLEAAVGVAQKRDVQHLCARAADSERGFPFSVALQLFEGRLRTMSAEERSHVLEGAAGLAGRLLVPTELEEAEAFAEQMFPLIHGLFWLTTNLADMGPLLITVDDVQASDEPSLRFLSYLAQRLEGLPVAMVLAARAGEHEERAELRELLTTSGASVVRPRPLSRAAVREVIEDELGFVANEDFADACLEVTGGNPLLLRELLAALASEGIDEVGATADRVRALTPDAVIQRLLVRIMRLPDAAASLARAVAVLGDGVPLRIAADLAGVELGLATKAVDALAAVEILQPLGEHDRVAFVHPLLRAGIYADQPAGERARMHARAATLLIAERASEQQIVSQLMRAQRRAVPEAADLLGRAATQARSRGALTAAAAFLDRALQERLADATRAHLLLELAQAQLALGELEAARASAERACSLTREPQEPARARLVQGRALYAAARHQEAAGAFQLGLDQLGRRDGCALAYELRAAYATAATLDASLAPQGVAVAELIVGQRTGDLTLAERALLAQLAAKRAFGAAAREEVLELADRAWGAGALLKAEGADGAVWTLVTAALACAGYLEQDVEICTAALDAARASGSVSAFATASYCRVWPLFLMGRVDEAVADAETAIAAHEHGWEQHLGSAAAMLARALIEKGELDAAENALQPIHGPEMAARVDYALLLEARGQLALARGHPDLALRDALEAGRLLVEVFAMPTPIFEWRSTGALAAAAVGDLHQAQALVAQELELARSVGAPTLIGRALRVSGLIETGRRRVELLAEAVTVVEAVAPRLELSRALIDYGNALRRVGQRRAARGSLERGLDLAARGGSVAPAEHARVELMALGARPRKDMAARDQLTASERRVAQMAASGMTNKQIAQALFVTVKAIEGHLHHAYQKLGIMRRSELPRKLFGDVAGTGGTGADTG